MRDFLSHKGLNYGKIVQTDNEMKREVAACFIVLLGKWQKYYCGY